MADLHAWLVWAPVLDQIYQEELCRSCYSDPEAFVNWTYHWRENGETPEAIRRAIRGSPEWAAKHPGEDPGEPFRPGPEPEPEPEPEPVPVPEPVPDNGSGGFVTSAHDRSVRPIMTVEQMRSFLPARGPFTFPPPYNTRGIRVTNPDDGRVRPIGMTYWPNINMHAGRPVMMVFLSLDDSLTLFTIDKSSGQVSMQGAIGFHHTGEGVYWSFSNANLLYVSQGDKLWSYDVATGQRSVVVDGSGEEIRQCHSSWDGQSHSMTLGGQPAFWHNGQLRRIPAADYDECQISKAGRWGLIKAHNDNIIIDLETGQVSTITDAALAVGHSDMGFDYVVGEENMSNPGGVFRVFDLKAARDEGIVYFTDWTGMTRYVSHCNAARHVPRDQQFVVMCSAVDGDVPRANEIVSVAMDGSLRARVLCPNLTILSASGGAEHARSMPPRGRDAKRFAGPLASNYWKYPRVNIDPTGEWGIWTANAGTDRMDAYMVRIVRP